MTSFQPGPFRYIIENARTGEILARDVKVAAPKVMRKLSGPAVINFDVDYRHPSIQKADGSGPIVMKPFGHICHVETEIYGGRRLILASGIFKASEVDPQTGVLHAEFDGFSSYAHGIPMLFNWNPIAVDPAEIVTRIWDHIQSYENGDLGVTIYSLDDDGVTKVIPAETGTQMLPGISYDGSELILDFFAVFIRAVDFQDSGDYIDKLSRDIPFDYFEESRWNEGKTAVDKFIQLAYPHGGVYQENLSFRHGENIIQSKSKIESEIQWASDIVGRGWFPGKVYSSIISNADENRLRRVLMENDANINSDERSAIWGHRQLTRRQWPNYWESIIVNMYHPNAPWGSYDVGDQIRVQGFMPWVGWVDQVHKIIAISVDEVSATVELALRAEGAFNYDPIFFGGNDVNLLENGDFITNLDPWTQLTGIWSRNPSVGNRFAGSAQVTADGTLKELASELIAIDNDDDWIEATAAVRWTNATSNDGSAPIWLAATAYDDDDNLMATPVLDSIPGPSGNSDGFQSLSGRWSLPNGVTNVRIHLVVQPQMTGGNVNFDDISMNKDD
jgi:hypothetical protein